MRLIILAAAAASTLTATACTRSGSVNPTLSVGTSIAPRYNSRHYNWCSRRYASYERATNTYKRSSGPLRRRCVSPFI